MSEGQRLQLNAPELRANAAKLRQHAVDLEASVIAPVSAPFQTVSIRACDAVSERINTFTASYVQQLRDDADQLERAANAYDNADYDGASGF